MRLSRLVSLMLTAGCPTVGGQAVLEGVMMRNGDAYALALRRPDGEIVARRMPWFSLTRHPWLKKPFVRGFPVLIETLVNGIKALNRSAEHQAEGTEEGQLEGLTVAQLRQTAAQQRHAHRGVDELVAQPHREQQAHTGDRDLRQGGDDLRELIPEHDIQKQENERQRGKPADKGTFFGFFHFEQFSFLPAAPHIMRL